MKNSAQAQWITLAAVALALAACGDSGSTTTTPTPTTPTTQQQVTNDIREAGEKIKDAASAAASQAGPALERAKQEGQQAIHDLSQKIADKTAPTTQP